jgi:ubiquinone biosynthesis monooxygenase Coq7
LREIPHRDEDEQHPQLVMLQIDGPVAHLGHQLGVVGEDFTVEPCDVVGELPAEEQAEVFSFDAEPGPAAELAMARHACLHGRRGNIAAMNITMSINATDLRQLSSSVPGLIGDIRSDHAGETGAVMIYRGILAGSRDPAVRRFAEAHMATEQGHLDLLDTLLPSGQRSVLLPVWRLAGWLTGFLPTLGGSHAVYATIDAVETFVDHHYEEQIRKLPPDGPGGALRAALCICQADEVHHRDEARALRGSSHTGLLRLWVWAVGAGSKAAVSAARRL